MEAQHFKDALSQWATGVTVVTTVHAGQRVGITASSFTSVGLTPPQILVCVAHKLYTHQAILASGHFAVNILHTGQQELGMRFAGMVPEIADRFAGSDWVTAVTGAPILVDALGWVDCTIAQAITSGDHTIFIGDVVEAGSNATGEPLLYFNRRWRSLA